jgi:hypothetical protein
MSESSRAILVDGHLHWLDDVPDAIRHGTEEVRVRVTIEGADGKDGDELGSLLDALSEADPYGEIDDPREWQRRLRGESDVD